MSRSKVLDLATSTSHQLAQAEAGLPLWPLDTTLTTRAFLHWGRSECNRSDQPGIAGEVRYAPDGCYVWGRLTSAPRLGRHERRGGGGGQGEGGRTVRGQGVVARVTHFDHCNLTHSAAAPRRTSSPHGGLGLTGTLARHGRWLGGQQFPHQPLTGLLSSPLPPTPSPFPAAPRWYLRCT